MRNFARLRVLTAEEIARVTGGTVVGDARVAIDRPSKLEDAIENSLCFFSNPKYEHALYESAAGIVLVPTGFSPSRELKCTLIEHDNPYYAFCIILTRYFDPNIHKTGIEAGSYISASAQTGEGVYIGTGSYIDDEAIVEDGAVIYPQVFVGRGAKIGKDTILYPGVKVYAGCIIGQSCIIHSGTVIGSDGFGFAPVAGRYVKIPQIGNVVIEDHVEIGSNCSIDRATMGSTIIRTGTKLDNLIQVAHNVEIGAHTVIAAQAGISGSTRIGAHNQIGGQVGIVGHITIADNTGIGAQAGVSKSIEHPGTQWIGSPASPLKEQFRAWAAFKNLPNLVQEIQQLKKELELLKSESTERQ
ncbi:MAG: UDP-3-O-(3-hydroxymyristoyl)glucosamine N-acyltransferase [Bacteroidetes bacterium]|nr:UDP-3-O-(3-hydroxymyristoyl)glucosamine N-acyltransferase [Bacteroidota bacterium]